VKDRPKTQNPGLEIRDPRLNGEIIIMNRRLMFILILSATLLGCAGIEVSPEFAGTQSFKGVRWGMSKDKVQVVIDRDLKKTEAMKYYMGDVMYGMPCKVTFEFGLKDNLRSIIIDFDTMNPDAEYDFVIKNITAIFGQPKKNSRESGVIWHSPDTATVLLMTGGAEKEMKLSFIEKEK
jgi:hypothetical protein